MVDLAGGKSGQNELKSFEILAKVRSGTVSDETFLKSRKNHGPYRGRRFLGGF
jgi:hypothetical protein